MPALTHVAPQPPARQTEPMPAAAPDNEREPIDAATVPVHDDDGPNLEVVGFNYKAIEAEKRERVKTHASRIKELERSAAAAIVEIGTRLIAVRLELNARQFRAWVTAELRWSYNTTMEFMRVGNRFASVECVHRFTVEAVRLLSAGKIPPAAIAAAIELAQSGAIVSPKDAQRIIARHSPPAVKKFGGMQLIRSIQKLRTTIRQIAEACPAVDLRRLGEDLEKITAEVHAMALRQSGIHPAALEHSDGLADAEGLESAAYVADEESPVVYIPGPGHDDAPFDRKPAPVIASPAANRFLEEEGDEEGTSTADVEHATGQETRRIVPNMGDVARHFGVSERSVNYWKREGIPGRTGAYDLQEIEQWAVRHGKRTGDGARREVCGSTR